MLTILLKIPYTIFLRTQLKPHPTTPIFLFLGLIPASGDQSLTALPMRGSAALFSIAAWHILLWSATPF